MNILSVKFPEDDIGLFNRVRECIEAIRKITLTRNGYDKNPEATSHIMASVVADRFGLRKVHGFFLNYPHTWVETPHGNIIDVMPMCSYEPLLLSGLVPHTGHQYKEVKAMTSHIGSTWNQHILDIVTILRKGHP